MQMYFAGLSCWLETSEKWNSFKIVLRKGGVAGSKFISFKQHIPSHPFISLEERKKETFNKIIIEPQ